MDIEYIERIEVGFRVHTWLVRASGSDVGGEHCLAHVHDDDDPAWNRRVEEGSRRWLAFRHPRIVPLVATQWHGSRLAMITGDERGPTLLRAAKHLADASVDREAWAVAEISALGEALVAMAAHEESFIHRRAGADHTVVGVDGRARYRAPICHVTVDRVTGYLGRPNQLMSFHWMSPEQVLGRTLTPASDVFTLASVLYTLFTGERLAKGETDFETLEALREPKPRPFTTRSPGLADVVLRGLARDRDERYRDPAAFVAALAACPPSGDPSPAYASIATWRPPASRPAPAASPAITGSRCQKQWDELVATPLDGVRWCRDCKHDVVRVKSVNALLPLLGQRCVMFTDGD